MKKFMKNLALCWKEDWFGTSSLFFALFFCVLSAICSYMDMHLESISYGVYMNMCLILSVASSLCKSSGKPDDDK